MELNNAEVNVLCSLLENEMLYLENCINEETDENYLNELKDQLQGLQELKEKILRK